MTKVSKVRVKSSRPADAPRPTDDINQFRCTRCGKVYVRQREHFPKTYSPLFIKNGGYLPICKPCVCDLYTHYKDALGDEKDAARRVCMKFDIYWTEKLFDSQFRSNTDDAKILGYIGKTNLAHYAGKSFDDTLDEERSETGAVRYGQVVEEEIDEPVEAASAIDVRAPDVDTVLFWGPGYTPEQYHELNLRFERWTKEVPKPMDPGTEALYKQICIAEMTINRNTQNGKSTESTQNALNNLLGSLNIKPNQRGEKEENQIIDSTPLGVWAKRWEDKRPIPDDDPELEDAHGVIKYISTWFLGHIGKMLGVKNVYSKLYDDQIAKMRVERPELSEEDDEEVFNGIFGNDGGDEE